MILGLPWLKKENPSIDWETRDIKLENSNSEPAPLCLSQINANCDECYYWFSTGIIKNTSNEAWILADYTYSQAIVVEANKNKYTKSFEELILKEYHWHWKVFSEEESHQLLKYQP